MENYLKQMGCRIKEMRSVLEIPVSEMAALHGISEQDYLKHENGEVDASFTFLYRCAERFGVDISSLITGDSPKLSFYTVTRKGGGTHIQRREGFNYLHQAALFKNRHTEPFIVTAPYIDDQAPIHLSTHPGQEFDYVIEGKLKVQLGDKVEILSAGDSVYYDSGHPHGMVAADGKPCTFLAVVMKAGADEHETPEQSATAEEVAPSSSDKLICHKYLSETIDENGLLTDVKFNVPDNFNFAFDVVDVIAERNPNKRAMLWVSKDKKDVRDFSFKDIADASARAANYLASLGIKKGDRVMLVLKRHYQFWFIINALHRLGAVAVPSSNQLTVKDFQYRFDSAEISAIICTADGSVAETVDEAIKLCPSVKHRIIVNGDREGWRNFDREMPRFDAKFERPQDLLVSDPILMFFSSGTTGYPKMVAHNGTYPLGHILTAKWWHNVDPQGLHFTISDTGWGKSLWGKIYGQWLCETAVFTYDFDRFAAAEILPLFKEYSITTFCAPPTMYRFFIKEDLSKYDFSALKYATTAGEALNPEVFQQFLQATGLKIMEGFGQTETTLLLATFVGMTPKPGAMGKPSPQFPVELLDNEGNPTKPGEVGEIVVKADPGSICGLFLGYHNDPELNAEACHDGYYHTGDTAWCDEEGYYWYVGRTDDLIKSSGYRIGPFEIESVIMELPYVLECAVVGVPDPVRGQAVKAFIVLMKGKEGSEELKKEIQDYVKKHTAPYKYPRVIEFIPELPKTISGKIRRVELRGKSSE